MAEQNGGGGFEKSGSTPDMDDSSKQGGRGGEDGGSSSKMSKYGHIRLDISNSVLPLEKLSPTPSSKDGLTSDTEVQIRSLSCELIQLAGKLLKLPQVAMATGCVLFQRFYYAKSFVRLPFDIVAMSCVGLASKIEEAPRRIRDIINVFNHIKQIRNGKPIQPVVLDQNYISLKNQVIKAERRVLKELGFCVHVKHPHKIIVMYLRWLELSTNQELLQMSWNFMNDSLRTDVFVRYPPETIATACIYLSARKLKVPLPKSPSWFDVLRVEEDDIRDCCYRIVCLYNTKKPNQDDLEMTVETLRRKMEEARRVNRMELSSKANTPLNPSSPATGAAGSKATSPLMQQGQNNKGHHAAGALKAENGNKKSGNDANVIKAGSGAEIKSGGGKYHDRTDDEDDDHYSENNSYYKKRKKHKRSRSRSNGDLDNYSRSRSSHSGGGGHRSDSSRKKHKHHKQRGHRGGSRSQSPGSPYSPQKKSKRSHSSRGDKRHHGDERDYRDHHDGGGGGRHRGSRSSQDGAAAGNRGGCVPANDNPYYDNDRDHRESSRSGGGGYSSSSKSGRDRSGYHHRR